MSEVKLYEAQQFENIKLEQQTIESCEFQECEFISCTFDECHFVNCRLTDCSFHNCTVISPRFKFCLMKFSTFTKCNLIGLTWHELIAAKSIAGPFCSLQECVLKYNSFIHMNLRQFSFSSNTVIDSFFEESNLMESSFTACNLTSTQFLKCDLRKADFRDAAGYQISISSNRLTQAKFSFPEVITLLSELNIQID